MRNANKLWLLFLLLSLPIAGFSYASHVASAHHHQHTVISTIITLVLIIGLGSRRLYRASKRGPRRLRLGTIILAALLLAALAPYRLYLLQQPPYSLTMPELQPIAFAWLGAYLLITAISFMYFKKNPLAKEGRIYWIPSKIYLFIIILLTLYALTVYIVIFQSPELLLSMSYLIITMVVKGIIAGFYLGILLSVLKHSKDPALSQERSDIDAS